MKALLIVDVQNDFMPGGALGVPDGDQIIPVIRKLIEMPFDCIVATKDWHPKNHGSFAESHKKSPGEHVNLNGIDQILWPTHCVQNTRGSDFASGWNTSKVQKVFFKGIDPSVDSYSAFFDNAHVRATGLAEFLKENKVDEIYMAGLATDYCVKYSVMDALKMGFKSYIVEDACKGINLNKDDVKKSLEEMKSAGGKVIQSNQIFKG